MISLTPADSSRILLSLVQFIRQQTQAGSSFTLANLATLLAVCENPGALQADLGKAVGGIDGGTLTRHLNMLSGIKRPDSEAGMAVLVRSERNVLNRRLNDVFLTPEGEQLITALAGHFNRLLTRTLERK